MNTNKTIKQRFFDKVVITNTCWLWQGTTLKGGYGHFRDGLKLILAHRWSYTSIKGPIPYGLQLDHLCRVRNCVNPDHLEPVSSKENSRRGNLSTSRKESRNSKTHCINGHKFTPENSVYHKKYRRCKICVTIQNRENGKRFRAKHN